jgi:TRAP-type C4-dicarboxylate transport system permease small subunit
MPRRILRITAAILILSALGVWLALGANRGWTRTSVPVKRMDEVTGITVDDYRKGFVPGLDFIGAALLGSAVLTAGSFLFRKPRPLTETYIR